LAHYDLVAVFVDGSLLRAFWRCSWTDHDFHW